MSGGSSAKRRGLPDQPEILRSRQPRPPSGPRARSVNRRRAGTYGTMRSLSSARRTALLLGIEQPVQVDDEIAHLRVVDRLLRLGLPGRIGGRVVRIDADDVELVEILELGAVEAGSVRRRTPDGAAAFAGVADIAMSFAQSVPTPRVARAGDLRRFAGLCAHQIDQRRMPLATGGRPGRRGPAPADCSSTAAPSSAVSTPPASCTKRSAAARSQSWRVAAGDGGIEFAVRDARQPQRQRMDPRHRRPARMALGEPARAGAWARRCGRRPGRRRRSPRSARRCGSRRRPRSRGTARR